MKFTSKDGAGSDQFAANLKAALVFEFSTEQPTWTVRRVEVVGQSEEEKKNHKGLKGLVKRIDEWFQNLDPRAKVALAVGVFFFLIALSLMCCCCCCRSKRGNSDSAKLSPASSERSHRITREQVYIRQSNPEPVNNNINTVTTQELAD